tara:strand:- start:2530 stop:4239 length:1710 start_codon:yes stop_codon:yes gene_type:complete
MFKNYLLLDNNLKNIKKSSKIIFFDEYSKNLIDKKILKKYQTSSLLNFNELKKFNYNSNLLNKKIKKYIKEFTIILNKIHHKDYNQNYWGLILDRIFYLTINAILFELSILKKIKKNKGKTTFKSPNFKNFFLDSFGFIQGYEENSTQPFIRYCVAKKLGFKEENFTNEEKKTLSLNTKKSFRDFFNIKNYLVKILQLYVKIFKPFLIIDGFIPKRSCIKIFLKSFGRILILPSNLFFIKKNNNRVKNHEVRKTLKITENDIIDKIFNDLIYDFFPASCLENFKEYDWYSVNFKTVPMLGTAVSLIHNDHFKYMAASIINKGGKLIIFQHGGLIGKEKYDRDEAFNRKYSTKVFNWDGTTNFIENYFERFDKIKESSIKKNKEILILSTRTKMKYTYNQSVYKKNHPYLNDNFKFYEKLSRNIKKKTAIKLFPNKYSEITKKIWIDKFGKNLKIINNKKNLKLFNNYKITIIDDISTPLCELMYVGAPFIIINNELEWLKKTTTKKIIKLKKLNMFFENPTKASKFLNKNYDNIDIWWKKNTSSNIYKDLEREIIPSKKSKSTLLNLLK